MRRAIIALASAVAVFAASAGIAPAAYADTPGISAEVLLNGEAYNGTPVVTEGDVISLRALYTERLGAGAVVEFDLGTNVTLTGVPAGNEAIESFEQQGNTVIVTFKSPWPEGVNQGVFDLQFTINQVEKSGTQTINWSVNGEENSIDVIVKDSDDNFANVTDGFSKSVTPGNLDSFVSVDDRGVVTVDPAISDQVLTYTLRVDSAQARTDFPIQDRRPAGTDYITGSFSATLTTWDENGLNRESNPFPVSVGTIDGGVALEVDLPGPSQFALTYSMKVTDPAVVQADLQAKFDALGGRPGEYSTTLVNAADFDGTERTASVRLRGKVAGVNVGNAFVKSASWTRMNIEADDEGTLTPAVDIDYTFKADLHEWDDRNPNFTLNRNVVISDVLPVQASWKDSAPDFLTATGISLTPAPKCVDATDFAADAYVGMYCVDGQTLLINVGKDKGTSARITAKAQLTTVDGLAKSDQTSVVDAQAYQLRNIATFTYDDGRPHESGFNSFPAVLPESDEGHNDPQAFRKTGKPQAAAIKPGESAVIDYTFSVGADKGIDMRTSSIVDYVDSSVFAIDDVSALRVSGMYDGQGLLSSQFSLSMNAEGNLVIVLSDSGKAVVDARGADKAFSVTVTLTTIPFEGKVTKNIKNKATLFGENDEPLYWFETSSEATSYGDEAEVRKRLLDPSTGDWVPTLDAQIGVNGELVRDVYTYRVEFLPRGSYDNVEIASVTDLLPSAVDFLGFVTEQDADDATNPSPGPVQIGGNIEAIYDQGVVTLKQTDGTRLRAGEPIAAYFAVKVTDHTAPIVNKIGTTEAIINPVAAPHIDIEKWSGASGPVYGDDGTLENDGYEGDFDSAPGFELTAGSAQKVNFTVSNDGGEALRDIVVTDTLTAGEGAIDDLVCTFPDSSRGTTWSGPFQAASQFTCEGTLPALPAGQSHADLATVTGVGVTSGDTVTDEDTWHAQVPDAVVPEGEGGDLATTGSALPVLAITFGAALVLALGAMLLLLTRRRMS